MKVQKARAAGPWGLLAAGLATAALAEPALTAPVATTPTAVQAAGGGAAADEYAKKSDLGFQWSGDVRFRLDNRFSNNGKPNERFRAQLRLGASGKFLDGVGAWNFRLATGTNDPVGRYVTLGGGDVNGGATNFGLDVAYLAFTPTKELLVIAGKVPAIAGYWTSAGIFDPDLTAEGLTVSYLLRKGQPGELIHDVSDTAGIYVIRNIPGKSTSPFAALNQLKAGFGPATVAFGQFHATGLNSLTLPQNLATLANWQLTLSLPQNSFTVLQGKFEVPLLRGKVPLNLGGEFWDNVQQSKHNTGYEASLTFPKLGAGRGKVLYRVSDQNSFPSPWVDNELGEGTGYHAGVGVSYEVSVVKNVTFGANYYRWDTFRPLTTGRGPTVNKLQLEVGASF